MSSNIPSWLNKRTILSVLAGVVGLVLVTENIGVNDAGYRTVIQNPVTGALTVKFDAGLYFPFFGKTTTYPDFITKDFSAGEGNVCSFDNNNGVRVRYQDGGEGVVCGIVNVQLPVTEDQMVDFHKRYRSEEGAKVKLLDALVPNVLNLTAGLMTSEESYATKRSEFINTAATQAKRGIYVTQLVQKNVQVGLDKSGKPEFQKRSVPEIVIGKDGQPTHQQSVLTQWGLTVTQFDLNAWDFEKKTLEQISRKREAEMAIVTAQANANRAYYEEQEVIAKGKKDVAAKEYQTKVAAAVQIEEAERDKRLAIIQAEKQKVTATELTLAAEEATKQKKQEALAALEEAKVITTLADAEAYRVDKVQSAGKTFRLIEAQEKMNADMAMAIQNMSVPSTITILGGGDAKSADAMQSLLQLGVMDKLGTLQNTRSTPK